MIKRNKLSIFLVAVVIMLTIYYIKTPTNTNSTNIGGGNKPVSSVERYPLYAETRINISKTRTTMIEESEAVLASSTTTVKEKETALETIANLNELTEKEITVETAIKNIGYQDTLVNASGLDVKIRILTENFTPEDFVAVAMLAKEEFGKDCKVSIEINQKN